MAMRRPAGPRVVFLPGTLGSVLVDQSLTPDQAREECRRNLGPDRDRRWRGKPWYPCDKRPETLWGAVGSLHWFFNPGLWLQRLTRGNGYDQGVPLRAEGLVDVDLVVWGRRVQVRPYATFLKALRDAGADVLVVPYDWRLSNRHNAVLLERRVLERWFGGGPPPQGRLGEAERITFIGHSMGGLVARCFLESRPLGPVLGRRLITVGTPHRGAPAAYLHLIGRTFPFPESPFGAWARATLAREAGSGLAAQLIPGAVQTHLVRFMASTFELLPNYNFVRNQGRTEEYPDTYANQVHYPTGQPAMQVLRRFRSGMVDERELEGWLCTRDLEYHFLGATGFSTVLGYDRGPDRLLSGQAGDGTVPLESAHLRPLTTGNLHTRVLSGEPELGHQKLCQRRDVQAYCLRVLRGRRPAAGAGPGQDPQVEDFVAMATDLLKNAPSSRGVVLSVVRLGGDAGTPLIDTTTERSQTSRRQQLKNPPRHVSRPPEIFEICSQRLRRTFRYVWILSNERATHPVGGMLFLPAAGERDVHLVTLNVGNLDDRVCRNSHHAEMQLVRWVMEQPATWRARLRTVHIANRSRSARIKGYSPCAACCSDLARFLLHLKALSGGRPIDARISWRQPYTRNKACGHPTDKASLYRLRRSGWELDDGRPAPRQPPPAPTPPPKVYVASTRAPGPS